MAACSRSYSRACLPAAFRSHAAPGKPGRLVSPRCAWRSCAAGSAAAHPGNDAEALQALHALAGRILRERALAEHLASGERAAIELLLERAQNVPAAKERLAVSAEEIPGSEGTSRQLPRTEESLASRLAHMDETPSRRQLLIYFAQHFVPFVGFGFCDNAVMLIAGEFLDSKFGLILGISTMGAAALGNTISDVFGLWFSGIIETAGAAMGLPESGLTVKQMTDIRLRIVKNCGMVFGITTGCFLGMFPLVWPESHRLW